MFDAKSHASNNFGSSLDPFSPVLVEEMLA